MKIFGFRDAQDGCPIASNYSNQNLPCEGEDLVEVFEGEATTGSINIGPVHGKLQVGDIVYCNGTVRGNVVVIKTLPIKH